MTRPTRPRPGSSRPGLAHQAGGEACPLPHPHRAAVEVVDPDDTDTVVGIGETGRAKLTTLTKEFFVPGFLERDEAIRIREGAGRGVELLPRCTLKELAAIVRRCGYLIAPDTGPLHIAAAVGAKTVSVFRVTDGSRNAPYGPNHRFLQARYRMPPEFADLEPQVDAQVAARIEQGLRMEGQLEVERAELRAELLQGADESRDWIGGVLIAGGAIAAAIGFALWGRRQNRRRQVPVGDIARVEGFFDG